MTPNCKIFSGLNDNTCHLRVSVRQESRLPETHSLAVSCLSGFLQGFIKLSARAAVLSEGMTAEGSASKLPYIVLIVGFTSSLVVGLRASILWSCRPRATLSSSPYGSSLYQSEQAERAREGASKKECANEMEVPIFCNLVLEVTSHHLCVFCSLEASHQVQPILKRKALYKGVNARRQDYWEACQKLPAKTGVCRR